MAEAARQRPIEYYNPRPLILGICFFWGVVMGFCLFYFAPPKQMTDSTQGRSEETMPVRSTMSELERRRLDTPNIAEVAPAPDPVTSARPRMEVLELEPPAPILSTEGGLSGRNAHTLAPQPDSTSQQPPQRRRPTQVAAPPPIPELMP
ncbi:MAG: hypothetical protein LUE17_15880 [Planctomycetaceae bacterium]|nr:hypothetical protein [Planctomycetaceae bacterium]